MEFAIPGFIGNFCTPNAIITLAEYLEDYASEETKKVGYELIEQEVAKLPAGQRKNLVAQRLNMVKQGIRDLYF